MCHGQAACRVGRRADPVRWRPGSGGRRCVRRRGRRCGTDRRRWRTFGRGLAGSGVRFGVGCGALSTFIGDVGWPSEPVTCPHPPRASRSWVRESPAPLSGRPGFGRTPPMRGCVKHDRSVRWLPSTRPATCGPAPLMEPTPTLDSGGWLSYLQISLFRQPMGGQSYMRLKRAIAVLTATAVSVIGLSLVAASPAAAGTWRAYGNTNPITSSSSTWRCAATKTISTNVLAQVCAIRSEEGSGVQGAVIVRNNRSSLYSVDASMDLKNSSGVVLGGWACPSSGVGANSWSVCFGSTLIQHNSVNSLGWAKGEYLGISPNV